ncbi:MAG: ABC transporter substrate-binding protein [Alphaproteobacteria bacterium]|nr:ABC transporter substrate-binding protein [Alphaproteobacteria bacterium]
MKSRRFKSFIYIISILVGLVVNSFATASPPPRFVVAITQIVPHPSLDLIRKGIEEELKDQGLICDIHFENAHGNIGTATQIAQKFASQKPDIIIPITTPSTQAVYAAASARLIPVVFAAVNNPVSIKLVPSMDKAGKGVTGVSDMPPISDQIQLIREILPLTKRVGVIYNPGESNSVDLLEIFEKELRQNGMTLTRATAATMLDVGTAAKSLAENVDVIYIPNDNTVVAALESLLKVAQENEIPVFCADPESVKQGCLAAAAHSQYDLGRQTGKMAARVLKGENIQTLPVERPQSVELSLNQGTAQKLKIKFPKAVVTRAKYIIKK